MMMHIWTTYENGRDFSRDWNGNLESAKTEVDDVAKGETVINAYVVDSDTGEILYAKEVA